MDIQITCQVCDKKFIFTEDEINYYKSRGWSPPKRCKTCRTSKMRGLEEISYKAGLKQSNFSANPKNHAGIIPVGVPMPTGTIAPPTQVIQLYCQKEILYLRVEQISSKKFTFLYLTSYERASQFHKDSDFNYILDLAMQHREFTDFQILYFPPSESNYESIEHLKSLQYDGELSSRFRARDLYLHRFGCLADYENDIYQLY